MSGKTNLSNGIGGKTKGVSQRNTANRVSVESARKFLNEEEDDGLVRSGNVSLPPSRTAQMRAERNARLNPIVAVCLNTCGNVRELGAKRIMYIVLGIIAFILALVGFSKITANEALHESQARFDTIQSRIIETGLTSQQDLKKEDSPQFKALQWVYKEDKAQLDANHPNILERYALAVFFHSTTEENNGANVVSSWKDSKGWMSEAGVCEWHGVQCFTEGSGLRGSGNDPVDSLSMTDNNLIGRLPSELVALTKLRILNLPMNKIEGTLPTQLSNLPILSSLILHDNQFEGTIPTEFGTFKKIKQLHLGNNNLVGEIPQSLENAYTLKRLALNDNRLEGVMPELREFEFLGTYARSLCYLCSSS